ncbi:MAG: alpha-galactosidase [Vagococcus sp.]|uniref:alpha-galactosidase n=1 Tax=Vagococcus sp. TaxID=1933889 RepID=UPI002FC9614C
MKSLIYFDEKQKYFHLSNSQLSYIMEIEEGAILSHIYFGKKINMYHGNKKYPRLPRGFYGSQPNSMDRGYSKDSLLQEFSSLGTNDYRVFASEFIYENGSNISDFVYKSHRVMDGKLKLKGLPSSYVHHKSESETLIVTLEDKISLVEVDLIYTIYRDEAVITRSTLVKNKSRSVIKVNKISSMQLDFFNEEFDVLSLPGGHVRERQVQREQLRKGIKIFESRRGTSSHQMNPFIALMSNTTTEFSGNVYGFHFVYSGNHSFEVEKDQLNQTRLVVGINQTNFSWELNPEEEFQTPEVIITFSDQGLNGLSQINHQFLRERVARGKDYLKERPIVINNWEATYFEFNESSLKTIVNEAKELGIEMFVLDDGWFGKRNNDSTSLGDWYVNQTKLPNGLRKFSDYVHSQGMQFGLWFEPEMISMESDLYVNHPDYLLRDPDKEPHPSRDQFVLDMGRSEVRETIYNQIKQLLDQVEIDYIKWDMNRHLSDVFSRSLPANRQGEASHRYMLGVYELLERLITEYPNVLWEGCSGGGGRFDVGFLHYMPQSWTSDNTDAMERLKIQYGTSIAYPISSMTAHVSQIPNHQTGRTTSLNTRGNVAMSGVLGYELNLTELSQEEKEKIKEQIVTYKEIRHIIQYGKFYRLKSPFEGNQTAWMFLSRKKDEIIVFAFSNLAEGHPLFHDLKLCDLEDNSLYSNLETNQIFGADELMTLGFHLKFVNRDFESLMYRFKKIN